VWACACAALLHAAPARGQEPPAAEPVRDGAATFRFTMDDRPTLHLGSLGEIRFRGRVEITGRTPQADAGRDADLRWQTRRLQIEGRLFDRLEFEVSREFGDSDEPERDAFLNLRLTRGLEVQAGRFKMPLGRDALTGGANLDFVFRSLAGRQLAPGRDVGVMAHGRLAARVLSYEAGYFRGDGDNARTSQTRGGRRAIAGRVVVSPFAGRSTSPLAGLQGGAAIAVSDVDTRLGLRGLTVFRDGVFFDRVVVNGRRIRQGLEAAWSGGPLSLTWERIAVSDRRSGLGFDGESLPGVRATGWYVAGTWTVTGEPKRARVEPRHGIGHGGLGAFEVAARYERLSFEPDAPATDVMKRFGLTTPANAERVVTLGLAWYLSRIVKVQTNAVFEAVADPQRSPAPRADGRFPSAVVQFQVAM
jgi:phosphate-selective porin OprO/OprP